MWYLICRAARDESGATAIEYGVVMGLLALGAVPALGVLGEHLASLVSHVVTGLDPSGPSVRHR